MLGIDVPVADQPKRLRILAAIYERLEAITKANGYFTDAGEHVHFGYVPQFGENDPKAVIAVLQAEDISPSPFKGGKVGLEFPVNVAAIVAPDYPSGNPGVLVELMLADIKRAVELEDNTLGGLLRGGDGKTGMYRGTTEMFERKAGSDPMGAQITYACPYYEGWGLP